MMLRLLPELPCLLLLSLPGPSTGSDHDGTMVLTTSGPIRGKRLPAGSSTVTAFLGIPYAQPPVGALRFQKPLPHQPWSDVLEATSFGHACPQPLLTSYPDTYMWNSNIPQSEDCLFLNIWVPHPRPRKPAPVLVWIHGMAFFSGAASLDVYDGRFLAAAENVIVVSMNYRLGALGFLALPPAAPGNAGLWDQRLALRWLRDNMATFGGNPARVMLFGQCAGGSSVGFHLLSPGSRALFTRAALQSGAPTAPWIWSSLEEAQERSRRLGQLLGCPESNDTALVDCLQGKEPGEFPKHELSILYRQDLLQFPFVPTVDGDFLPDTPPRLLQAQHGQAIPILTGMNANEGSYILLYAVPNLGLENTSAIGWEYLLQAVRLTVPRAPEEAVRAVAQRYIQEVEGQGEAQYRWAMDQMFGDYFVVCPVAEVAGREAEAGSPVYAYHFAHRTSGLSTPEWTGVPHDSELPYVFGTQASVAGGKHIYTEAEVGLSRRMMRYWAEFARSGSPTGEGGTGEPWPRYDPLKQNFFRIRLESSQVVEMELTRHCSFLAPLRAGKSSLPGAGSGFARPKDL